MITTAPTGYAPREFSARTFHDAVPQFRDGADTPRAYLERCLETIAEREAVEIAQGLTRKIVESCLEHGDLLPPALTISR